MAFAVFFVLLAVWFVYFLSTVLENEQQTG